MNFTNSLKIVCSMFFFLTTILTDTGIVKLKLLMQQENDFSDELADAISSGGTMVSVLDPICALSVLIIICIGRI